MNDLIEEPYNPEQWWLLQEISKEYLAKAKDIGLVFALKKSDGSLPPVDRQRKLLHKLIGLKILQSMEPYDGPYPEVATMKRQRRDLEKAFMGGHSDEGFEYVLGLDWATFDKFYRHYELKAALVEHHVSFDEKTGNFYVGKNELLHHFKTGSDPYKAFKTLWDNLPNGVTAKKCGISHPAFRSAINRFNKKCQKKYGEPIQSLGGLQYRLLVDKFF